MGKAWCTTGKTCALSGRLCVLLGFSCILTCTLWICMDFYKFHLMFMDLHRLDYHMMFIDFVYCGERLCAPRRRLCVLWWSFCVVLQGYRQSFHLYCRDAFVCCAHGARYGHEFDRFSYTADNGFHMCSFTFYGCRVLRGRLCALHVVHGEEGFTYLQWFL